MSNKSSEKSDLSELEWASERLQKNIAPKRMGSVKERIREAAVALGWKHSRARTVWYADERASLKPKELRKVEEVSGVNYGQQEVRSVEQLIANADALLMGNDPDFVGAFVTALRTLAGALDRSRTGGGKAE